MVHIINRDKNTENSTVVVKKFLTFRLGDEEYAIDILKVQEIMATSDSSLSIKKIENAPGHIKGIAYLHDIIVPIIDLRVFYQLKLSDISEFKVIIVLNLDGRLVGVIVDNVEELIELNDEQIKQTPQFCYIIHDNYIQGIGAIGKKVFVLLDIGKLILSNEMQLISHVVKT